MLKEKANKNRTTISLPDDLHRQLKIASAERGITMQSLLEQAFKLMTSSSTEPKSQPGSEETIPENDRVLVHQFLDFWHTPRSQTEEYIRTMMQGIFDSRAAKRQKKNTA